MLAVGALAPTAACGGGGGHDAPDATVTPSPDAAIDATDPDAPKLRNVVRLPDDELAVQALQLLGGPVEGATGSCVACHSITRQRLRNWSDASVNLQLECLTDLAIETPDSARATIECLRWWDPKSPFRPQRLGIYSTAADLPWFTFLFERAYGAEGAAQHDEFVDDVRMPRAPHPPLTQPQFDVVAEWFARNLPLLDELVPPADPAPPCEPSIGAGVAPHVAAMATTGWRAVNTEQGVDMFGCGDGAAARDCLASFPRAGATPVSTGWETIDGTVIRVLRRNNYISSYWTRSSADGRFVAHGGGLNFGSTIIDMGRSVPGSGVVGFEIPTNASFDPGFFPDNSAFAFQGNGFRLCSQSVLTAAPSSLNLDEPGCTDGIAVALYQHFGAALGGGDYWSIDGQFDGDNGPFEGPMYDPPASADEFTSVRLTPMLHNGTTYVARDAIGLALPDEGDSVISPSARLLVSRASGDNDLQNGFVLRKLVTTRTADGYTVEAPELARYCVRGGKPDFSFDERWLVVHHYIDDADAVDLGFTGADDPGFAAFRAKGAANVYLVDLLDGSRHRITSMHPGQFALFPHFRSDGWIYFMVKDLNEQSTEYVVASDAALALETP